MIFKYDVKKINGLNYIIGSRLIEEFGNPSEEHEFKKPLGKSLLDENDKLQWTIRDNPDYNPETDRIDDRYLIEHNPIPKTPGEIAQEEKQAKKDRLDAGYPQDKILELQDQAIQALAKGKGLPEEYTDYVGFREGIYAGKK